MFPNKGVNFWEGFISMPFPTRLQKPRQIGLTMVMDKGLGLKDTVELLKTSGPYIDFIKLGFGTAALYPSGLLREKIAAIRSYNIDVYPGGTFLEIAILQKKTGEFLVKAQDFGFSAIEVSDGTIQMSPATRKYTIAQAKELGFKVLTEVGKKNPAENLPVQIAAELIRSDLRSGADYVIMEARESGKGIGIYNEQGGIRDEYFARLMAGLPGGTELIWEAPLKSQQQELILNLGPNVNLGNIPPAEILALEALRLGLRGDTLRAAMHQSATGVPVEC